MVMFHTNLKERRIHQYGSNFFGPQTHPRPQRGGPKGQNIFSESSRVAYQIKGNGE